MAAVTRKLNSLLYRLGGNNGSSACRFYQPVVGSAKVISPSFCSNSSIPASMAIPLVYCKCFSMNTSDELSSFLKRSKACIKSSMSSPGSIHVVIGNEAADLDSVVSAVVYAFYLSTLPPVDEDVHYVPIISIHQDDLSLRTDIVALLEKLHIPAEDLVYLNDVDTKTSSIRYVTLVDFNNQANHLKELSNHVCRIIDHHEDSKDFEGITKTIKTVGSCATLITEQIHYSQNSVLSTYPIADLLLAAILIDTYNLDLHSGRTTELDIFMGEILTNHTNEDPDQFFDYLQKAKMDISSMKTLDILRKDYKPVPSLRIGISSATISSLLILSRKDFLTAAQDYVSKIDVDVLVIMFLSFETEGALPHREIAVVSMSTDGLENISSYLLSFKNDLQLCERHDIPNELKKNVRLFNQNPKLSRKFVLPLLKKLKDL